jgi:hypothetical protein
MWTQLDKERLRSLDPPQTQRKWLANPDVGKFVFALWGGIPKERWVSKIAPDAKRQLDDWQKVRRGKGATGANLVRKLNGSVYSFDDDARSVFDNIGLASERLEDDSPACNTINGQWRRKVISMRRTLEEHEQVLWLDIDCVLTRPIPPDFWRLLARGAALQAPLQEHDRRHAFFRQGNAARYLIGGWCWYCRETSILDRLLEIMDEHPDFIDEHALSFAIDEMTGGWQGPDHYRERGHHLPWVRARHILYAPNDPVLVH